MATGWVGIGGLPGRRIPPSYKLSSVASLATAGDSPVAGVVDSAGKAHGDVRTPPPPDAVYVANVPTRVGAGFGTVIGSRTTPG
jgi:hypothetical protein